MAHPGGRPTDYSTEFCQSVLEWGAMGKSKTWMCAAMGIARPTIYEWCEKYPEFSNAIDRAMALSQQWWEDCGQTNIISQAGRTLNSGVYSRSMAARFPDEWREKNETTLTGTGKGGAINIIASDHDEAL